MQTVPTLKDQDPSALIMIPFGGCGEFGLNMTAYVYMGRLFLMDCGLMFPDATKLGIDALIPDADEVIRQYGGVAAYILTHGHEDHIGAMPFVARKWQAPIYGTGWTLELVKEKFVRHGLNDLIADLNLVRPGDKVPFPGGISFEFVHVNHSIPMTCAVVVRTPAGIVFHSGDFKIDPHATHEPPMDLELLARFGDEGIAALLCDSTNATTPANGPSEADVREGLKGEIRAAPSAVFITTFASNFWRLRTIMDVCAEMGKRLFVFGAGMRKSLGIASELSMVPPSRSCLVDENDVHAVPRSQLVVIVSGCQGEPGSALHRLAVGETRKIMFSPGDTLIFSSRVIPGNEHRFLGILNNCAVAGVRVVTNRSQPNVHASGHACQPDIRELLARLRPRHFLPVHGSYLHLIANRGLGAAAMNPDRVVSVENGMVLQLKNGALTQVGRAESSRLFVDSWSAVPIKGEVLRDRLRIGSVGLVIISGAITHQGLWLAPLEIDLVGFGVPDDFDQEAWRIKVSAKIVKMALNSGNLGADPRTSLNESIRLMIRRDFSAILNKKLVVMPKLFLSGP